MIKKDKIIFLEQGIIKFLNENSFKKIRGNILNKHPLTFLREKKNSSEKIMVSIYLDKRNKNIIHFNPIHASKKYLIIDSVLANEEFILKNYIGMNNSTITFARFLDSKGKMVDSDYFNNNVVRLLNDIIAYLTNRVFPTLKMFDDIRVLDAEINKDLDYSHHLMVQFIYFQKLVISRLAGNPIFDELYQHIVKRHRTLIEKYPEEKKYRKSLIFTEKLYQKLSKIEPLDNPIIG